MPIVYGRVTGGARPWEIQLSTLPWLEGRSWLADETGVQDAVNGPWTFAGGAPWRVEDSSLSAEALKALLAGPR
jgi:hypothetical protein